MKNKSTKMVLCLVLCIILLLSGPLNSFGQQNRFEKVRKLYDSIQAHQLANPESVMAQVIYETGWLECKDCSAEINNLFGFRTDENYLRFRNVSECLAYMKKWQQKFYLPWKTKHPNATYYEFLVYIKYAENMPEYVKNVKKLERWISLNLPSKQSDFSALYTNPEKHFMGTEGL